MLSRPFLKLLFVILLSTFLSAQGVGGKTGLGGKAGFGGGVSGGVAVTSVQTTSVSNAAGTTTPLTAWGVSVTTGNDIYVGIASFVATGTLSHSSVTDACSNTYTVVVATQASIAATHASNLYTEFWKATNVTGGACTITINNSPSGTNYATAWEVTPGSTTVDAAQTGSNASANAWSAGSVTPVQNGEFLMSIGILDDGFGFASGWFTLGTGWGTLNQEAGGGNFNMAAQSLAQSTAAAITATVGTNQPGTVGPVVASVLTVKK